MSTEDQSRSEFEARWEKALDEHRRMPPSDARYWAIWAWQASRRTYRASVLEEAIGVLNQFEASMSEEGSSYYLRRIETELRALATQTPPCRGTACGTTTGEHSAECVAEHARAVAGLPRA